MNGQAMAHKLLFMCMEVKEKDKWTVLKIISGGRYVL